MGRLLRAACLAMLLPAPAQAQQLAVVIDDLGNSRAAGMRAIHLPAALTVAVLPFSTFAGELAGAARERGQDVIVHLPMQSVHGHRLGPLGLTAQLSREEFTQRVQRAVDAVPFARGASNHMGSLLTSRVTPMRWLMEILAAREGWLFLDSRTTRDSVARLSALGAGVAALSRDVFLDNERSVQSIRGRLQDAVRIALRRGRAIAIGHPHPSTLSVLENELPRLQELGVRTVTLSAMAAESVSDPRLVYTGYGSWSGGQEASTR